MADYETHEYDVLVIGAGGAGLRAAVEASALGAKTGLVCKSLLGKAHTVMAEGGCAAAMRNGACSGACPGAAQRSFWSWCWAGSCIHRPLPARQPRCSAPTRKTC